MVSLYEERRREMVCSQGEELSVNVDRGVDGTLQNKAGVGAGVEVSEEAGISSYQAQSPGKHLGRSTILAGGNSRSPSAAPRLAFQN